MPSTLLMEFLTILAMLSILTSKALRAVIQTFQKPMRWYFQKKMMELTCQGFLTKRMMKKTMQARKQDSMAVLCYSFEDHECSKQRSDIEIPEFQEELGPANILSVES